jgi:hypothetical protein
VRKDHVSKNFVFIRRIVLNQLRKEKTAKGGFQAKRLLYDWDETYFVKVLSL